MNPTAFTPDTASATGSAGSAVPVKLQPRHSLPRFSLAALLALLFILKLTAELTFLLITLFFRPSLPSLLSPKILVTLLDLGLSFSGFYLFVLHACCHNQGYISAGMRQAGHVAAIVVLDALCCRYNVHHPFAGFRTLVNMPLYGVLAALGYAALHVNDTAILISYLQPVVPVAQPHAVKRSEEIVFTNPFRPQETEPASPQPSGPVFMQPRQPVLVDAPPAYLYPTFSDQPTVFTDVKA